MAASQSITTIAAGVGPAGGENRPRRSFLASLSAFVTTSAALATPLIAAQATPHPTERPEFLAFGEELHKLLGAYREAVALRTSAREHYERIKPAVPNDLIEPPTDRFHDLSVAETDIDGNEVTPRRRIYDRKCIHVDIIRRGVSGRTGEGRRLHRLLRLAKAYEASVDRAIETSGYRDADHDASRAAVGLCGLTQSLLQLEPATMAGLTIYAEAIGAIHEARSDLGMPISGELAGRLAKAVVRIAGGHAHG